MYVHPCIKFNSDIEKENLYKLTPQEPTSEEWESMLDSKSKESIAQDFFERYPSYLPGLSDFHNGPLHGIIVSKLPLARDHVTDFAFITRNSMMLQFTFIELEKPGKPIFNKNGSFSKEFEDAQQQILDWTIWAEKNIDFLKDIFSPLFKFYNAQDDYVTFKSYLVSGRREDVEKDKIRKNRWSSKYITSDRKIELMTYDRIYQNSIFGFNNKFKEKLITCSYRNKDFYVKKGLYDF